jgi:hypothetical protein
MSYFKEKHEKAGSTLSQKYFLLHGFRKQYMPLSSSYKISDASYGAPSFPYCNRSVLPLVRCLQLLLINSVVFPCRTYFRICFALNMHKNDKSLWIFGHQEHNWALHRRCKVILPSTCSGVLLSLPCINSS